MMDGYLVFALLMLGSMVGFLAGLLGVGGGMMLVPFMTMLFTVQHFPSTLIIHMAVATSLAVVMLTSLSSMRAHHQQGAISWSIVRKLVPGIVLGSWIGPWLGTHMNTRALATFFGVFVLSSAIQMWFGAKPAGSRTLPNAWGMWGAGSVIGVISGLVGAGGGFVSVPFMTWCNVKMHNAVATSAALGFPIALFGTLSNVYYGLHTPYLPVGSFGLVYVPALVALSIASILTAPIGARTAHRLPIQALRKIFSGMLCALASYMLWRAYFS